MNGASRAKPIGLKRKVSRVVRKWKNSMREKYYPDGIYRKEGRRPYKGSASFPLSLSLSLSLSLRRGYGALEYAYSSRSC